MITLECIKQKIEQALPGATVELFDESAHHKEHEATGAHIAVRVTYPGFAGMPLVKQHQMIYDVLQEEMKEQIHALKIKTRVNDNG